MHRAGLQMAVDLQAQRREFLVGPGAWRFQIDGAVRMQRAGRGAQGGFIDGGRFERRIEQHQMHAAGDRALDRRDAVGALDAHHLGLELRLGLVQLHDQIAFLLAQQDRCRAARCCFESQRAGAGEGVDDVPARQIAAADASHAGEPVEQRLADAVGCGAETGFVGDGEARALPLTTDDAHFVRALVLVGRLLGFGGRNLLHAPELSVQAQGFPPTTTVTMRSGCSLRAKAALMSAAVTAFMRAVQVSR